MAASSRRPGNVAIVGAGVAGLACGQALRAEGVAVRLFDEGPAPGGRVATCRTAVGAFDHGAAYFTVRDPAFAAAVAGLGAATAAWGGDRRVGVPAMSALPEGLAAGLDVRPGVEVTFLARLDAGWMLVDGAHALHGPFDAVVVAVPAPQAAALLAPADAALAARAGAARYAPCWALLAAWEMPLPIPDRFEPDGGRIGWAARETARPGRAPGERWVVHASPAFSAAHLEATPAEMVRPLVEAFLALVALPVPPPDWAEAHRWRHARVTRPAGAPCFTGVDGLVACGDWCLGPRVEAAWLSGTAAARALLA